MYLCVVASDGASCAPDMIETRVGANGVIRASKWTWPRRWHHYAVLQAQTLTFAVSGNDAIATVSAGVLGNCIKSRAIPVVPKNCNVSQFLGTTPFTERHLLVQNRLQTSGCRLQAAGCDPNSKSHCTLDRAMHLAVPLGARRQGSEATTTAACLHIKADSEQPNG